MYQRVVSLTWSNPVNDDELFPFEIVNLQRINSLMVQYYSSINFDQRVKLERKESLKLKGVTEAERKLNQRKFATHRRG